MKGEVLAVGSGIFTTTGTSIPMKLMVGDNVIVPNTGIQLKLDGETLLLNESYLDNINTDYDTRSNDRVTYFTPEGNVQLNYQLTGEDGLTGSNAQDNDNSGHPDFVENMGQYIEDALAVYIELGWINPLNLSLIHI